MTVGHVTGAPTATPTFGLWYDFRNPTQWRRPSGELYRATIDQIVWAEQLGFAWVWLSEHHFAEDDYAAAPLVAAQQNKYVEWGSFEGPDQPSQYADARALLDSGAYRLMDASMAVDELVGLAEAYPQIRDFHYWAQLPGESVESGSERIQYLADRVIPEVTRRLGGRCLTEVLA